MTPLHADAVRANMAKEVRAGRRSVVPPGGRLDGRPILFSPIGIVEKRVWRPAQGPQRFAPVTKLREIHHLSYPTRGTGISVNDLLTSKCGKYGSIDSACKTILRFWDTEGEAPALFKTDVIGAYRLVPTRPDQRWLSGMSFEGVDYVDNVLGFGNRRSSDIWGDFAEAFRDIVIMYAGRKRIKVDCVLYVDDYLWCVRWSQVDGFLAIVRELEARLGVFFDLIKEEGPSGALGFLGVWLDGQRRHIELTPQRVAESAALVASWLHPPALATAHFGVSELAKLAGSLTFTARALANARTFTRRIYEQLAAAEATPGFRGDKRRLPADLRADLEWFAAFLPTAADRPVPMISPDWDWDVDVIHSDATPAIGAGATLSRAPRASDHRRAPLSWFAHEWTDAERSGFERSRAMSANHAESLAAIMAIRAWGPSLRGRRVLIHCDNAVTVAAWQSGYSRDPHLMAIVRELWLLATRLQISVRIRHIAGVDNTDADDLSRGRIDEFLARLRPGEVDARLISPAARA